MTKSESRPLAAGGGAWDKAARPLSVCIIPQPAKTATPRHGRVCGTTWRKTVRASVHMLRFPRGWAVDVDDLEAALAAGAVTIEIEDTETGVTWSAPLSAFRAYGLEINRGFGAQVALPLPHWSRRKGEAEAQQLELALFGAGGGGK